MRRKIRIPRIIRINWIDGLRISVTFNNGESRIIDFHILLKEIGTNKCSPGYVLFDPLEFQKVELRDTTLSWYNVDQWLTHTNGKKEKVPFEIGPDKLYQYSIPENTGQGDEIGAILKNNRLEAGLTQQELARRSGTSRNYISRIENNRSDIELGTLRKIIEIGLGKKLEIRVR